MNSSNRSTYVDIAKGLAILSVVLLHIDFVFPQSKYMDIEAMLGWYWHVPVFFIIGGFFLKDEKLQKPIPFIKGKFVSLYKLALCIYLPVTLLHNVFFSWGWYSTEEAYGDKVITVWGVKDYILGVLKVVLCAGREPLMGAMWFVYALLFALCGYSVLTWFVKKAKWGVLASPYIARFANSIMYCHECCRIYNSKV